MLTIRLARVGHKGQARFRLVAADKSRHVTGKFVSILGHYDPHSKQLEVNQEELDKHFKNGAQPSSSVVKLLKRQKIKMPKWAEANLVTKQKPPKAKAEAAAKADAPADAPAASPAKDQEAPSSKSEEKTETKEAEIKSEDKEETPKPAGEDSSEPEPAKAEKSPESK